ncbi:MAG: glycosyltransferase family 4 protein [Parvularculaceae bacterium]|nr:glycosyltransferase family 4 protein [Parvularculaceae bacterium]
MRFENSILQVVPALEAGGAERTTLEMTRAIVGAGGRALVATAGGRLAGEIEKAGGQVILMPAASKNPLVIVANRARLIRLMRAENVDLVHARSRAPAWSALMAARAAGVPFVATYHGAYDARTPIKRFYNSAMARADLVIANSQFTAAAVRRIYDPGERLVVIARGADLEEFNPDAISRDRIRAIGEKWRLGEESGRLVILLPGRLTDWKGHETAIRAARVLKQEVDTGVFPRFRLIFAGDSQGRRGYAASLMRMVSELGLEDVVSAVGHCADMPAAYAVSDIVLSPSTRPEAFGRVAAEAGAMARVCIAADHGGARETVEADITGFLVEPGSHAALADALGRAVLLGGEGRRAMGARARARISARYSTRAMCDATLAAYRSLLERTKSGNGVGA